MQHTDGGLLHSNIYLETCSQRKLRSYHTMNWLTNNPAVHFGIFFQYFYNQVQYVIRFMAGVVIHIFQIALTKFGLVMMCCLSQIFLPSKLREQNPVYHLHLSLWSVGIMCHLLSLKTIQWFPKCLVLSPFQTCHTQIHIYTFISVLLPEGHH